MQTGAAHNPAHMGPPSTVVWSVRIAGTVSDLVMDSVRGHPEHRPAFKRERSANREEILDPFGRRISAMGQQAMVAHADAHIDRKDVEDCSDGDGFPRKEKESSDSQDMKKDHEGGRQPIAGLTLCCAAQDRRRYSLRTVRHRLLRRRMRFFHDNGFNRTFEQFCWHIVSVSY